MNKLLKRIGAGLLALFIVIALFPSTIFAAQPITTPPTGYTSASDVQYVKAGKYVVNWGARGETAKFLSTYAQNFYTGSYTYATLSSLTGGSSQSNAPQSALYSSLKSLMSSKQTLQTSYQATRDLYRYTDCVRSDYSKISSFYSGTTLNGAWDSGSTWNREHTWPNSKGLGGNDENDIMMLRPTAVSENSSRGNKAYGETGGYFDPGPSTRGDVARIMLYVYVRWGNTSRMWGTSGVMENVNILLKWMKEDPVDTWEMGRNDAVQSITGTRNVFVDYPELAWKLFGQTMPAGVSTPSTGSSGSTNPGGSTGSTTRPTTTPTTPSTTPTTPTNPGTTSSQFAQVSSLSNGDQIIFVNTTYKKALSTNKISTYYNVGVDVSGGYGSITSAEIFTVRKNSDGTYSFTTSSGKKLAMADGYNSLNESGKYDKWYLSNAGSGRFYLRNAGRNTYLEWYAEKGNWSTYNSSSLDNRFVLTLYKKTSSGGTVTPPTTQPTTPTTRPTTQPTVPPTTQPVVPPTTQPVVPPTTQPTVPPSTGPIIPPPTAQPSTPPATKPTTVTTEPTEIVEDYVEIENDEDNSKQIITIVMIVVAVISAGGIAVLLITLRPKKEDAEQ